MVDQERAQQIAEQYSRQAEDFDRRHDEYLRAHPDPSDPGSEVDWQKEVETEQNMRVVAEMQVQLQREIRLEREVCHPKWVWTSVFASQPFQSVHTTC